MQTPHDADMPAEIDFSTGVRGQFHRPGVQLDLPADPEGHAQTVAAQATTDDPVFGMWRDREDMADVAAYIRRIRAPRFKRDGTRNKP